MRVRLRFAKLGKVRFTSHRDMARIWERVLRRAELPVATSEGFSPRPKVHFGLALSTGHESLGEYIDIDLRPDQADRVDLESLPKLCSELLPVGVEVTAAAPVDRKATSLQQAVTSCTWMIQLPALDADELVATAEGLLASSTLPITRMRKGKEHHDDLRPAVAELTVVSESPWPQLADDDGAPAPVDGPFLRAELATQPRGVRPAELLELFEQPHEAGRVLRTHQWIALDGARHEPLPAATRAPHVQSSVDLGSTATPPPATAARAS